MTDKEKFLTLVSGEKTNTLDEIKWRKENNAWLKYSQGIALKILSTLRERKMSQKKLADLLGVSPQQVNKWLKGRENFRLDTISKIETALEIRLVEVRVIDPSRPSVEFKSEEADLKKKSISDYADL